MSTLRNQRTAEQLAEDEVYIERDQATKELDDFLHKIHGQFINESDFYTPDTPEKERKEAYQKFVNLYIALYYEPLDEEYDEARYFTKDFDKALLQKYKYGRISLWGKGNASEKGITNIEVVKKL